MQWKRDADADRQPSSWHRRGILLICLLATLGLTAYGLARRPVVETAEVNFPDGIHSFPVWGPFYVTQGVNLKPIAWTGVAFFLAEEVSAPPDTTLILHIRDTDNHELRTVQTSLAEARTTRLIRREPTGELINRSFDILEFEFRLIPAAGTYRVTLESAAGSKDASIPIAYQIDDEKYRQGHAWYGTEARTRDLGFILLERPTVAVLIARWLTAPEHRFAALGSAAVLVGAVTVWLRWPHRTSRDLFWAQRWASLSWRQVFVAATLFAAVVAGIYWPATEMYFIQDDIPKLARVKFLGQNLPKLFFTNHYYVPPGSEAGPPSVFYRPFSNFIYSWLLYTLIGLKPAVFHVLNMAWMVIAAALLMMLGVLLARSHPAAILAALAWLVHTTKVPLVYWWSSVEDLIGSTFLLGSLLLYLRLRARWTPMLFAGLVVCYTLAVLSKEMAVLVPLFILAMELVIRRMPLSIASIREKSVVLLLGALLLVAGSYLIVRTVAIHDPTLPPATSIDTSYDFHISARTAVTNSIAYLARTVESWLFPPITGMASPTAVERALESFLGGTGAPPYYPAVLLVVAYALFLGFNWRQRERRQILLFIPLWGAMALLPNLFLVTSAWSSRWLTLATWSFGLLVALPVVWWMPKGKVWRTCGTVSIAILLVAFGALAARLPQHTNPSLRLSELTRLAVSEFERQASYTAADSVIYVVGAPQETRGSVSAELFRLVGEEPFDRVEYVDQKPTDRRRPRDVVIDLTNQTEYWR